MWKSYFTTLTALAYRNARLIVVIALAVFWAGVAYSAHRYHIVAQIVMIVVGTAMASGIIAAIVAPFRRSASRNGYDDGVRLCEQMAEEDRINGDIVS